MAYPRCLVFTFAFPIVFQGGNKSIQRWSLFHHGPLTPPPFPSPFSRNPLPVDASKPSHLCAEIFTPCLRSGELFVSSLHPPTPRPTLAHNFAQGSLCLANILCCLGHSSHVLVSVWMEFSFVFLHSNLWAWGFPGGAVVENLPANAGDTGLGPGLGRSHMPRSN